MKGIESEYIYIEKSMHMVHAGGRPLLDINAIYTPF
jgi:hypothetical protein